MARAWVSGHHDALATRRVRWGVGAIGSLQEDIEDLGASRAFVLTTRSLEGTVAPVVEAALGSIGSGSFGKLRAHVPAEGVARAVEAVDSAAADVIVSVGGGSVIDAAKAVVIALREKGGNPPRHVAVPTTLSGSEYAHFYGVTQDGFKQSHIEPDAVPELVVLDPVATESTPRDLWNGSGFKALDHAVETLRAPGERPIVDPLALVGIREMVAWLEKSSAPGATEARVQAQLAAWQCYFAPANATLGLSHRIGHILGGTYGVPHAAGSSITLPAVLEATVGLRPGPDAAISEAIGSTGGGSTRSASSIGQALAELAARLGLPSTLSDVGVDRRELPRIAELLRESYPQNVAELGDDASDRLDALLLSIA